MIINDTINFVIFHAPKCADILLRALFENKNSRFRKIADSQKVSEFVENLYAGGIAQHAVVIGENVSVLRN